jgi:hypothetical protein
VSDGRFEPRALTAHWPLEGLDQPSAVKVVVLGLILFVLLVTWHLLVRWLMAGILGVGELFWLDPFEARDPEFGRGVLLIRRSDVTEDCGPSVKVFDLRFPPKEAELRQLLPYEVKAEAILVKHLEERLEDLPSIESTLQLLETLVMRQDRPVIVVSAVSPIAYMRRRLQSTADSVAGQFITPAMIGRWARLLEQLARIDADELAPVTLAEMIRWFLAFGPAEMHRCYAAKDSDEKDRKDDEAKEFESAEFESEVIKTPRLYGIAWEYVWQRQIEEWKIAGVTPDAVKLLAHEPQRLCEAHKLPRLEDLAGEKLQALLTDVARAHYEPLVHLTDDEQLIPVQLGKEGYVNPRA